jgi:TonB family protein
MASVVHGPSSSSRLAFGRLALILSIAGHGVAVAAVGARSTPVQAAIGPEPFPLLTVDLETAIPVVPPPPACTPPPAPSPAPAPPPVPVRSRRVGPTPPAPVTAPPAPPPAPSPAPSPAPAATATPGPAAAGVSVVTAEAPSEARAAGSAGPAASGAAPSPAVAGTGTAGAPAGGGGVAPPAEDDGGDMASYGMQVYARILAAVQFPEQASRERVQGIVNVQIMLELDGRLRSATIVGPSEPLLREAALDAVRRAAPFPTPPRRLVAAGAPIAYELPLRFFLKQ